MCTMLSTPGTYDLQQIEKAENLTGVITLPKVEGAITGILKVIILWLFSPKIYILGKVESQAKPGCRRIERWRYPTATKRKMDIH